MEQQKKAAFLILEPKTALKFVKLLSENLELKNGSVEYQSNHIIYVPDNKYHECLEEGFNYLTKNYSFTKTRFLEKDGKLIAEPKETKEKSTMEFYFEKSMFLDGLFRPDLQILFLKQILAKILKQGINMVLEILNQILLNLMIHQV